MVALIMILNEISCFKFMYLNLLVVVQPVKTVEYAPIQILVIAEQITMDPAVNVPSLINGMGRHARLLVFQNNLEMKEKPNLNQMNKQQPHNSNNTNNSNNKVNCNKRIPKRSHKGSTLSQSNNFHVITNK